MPEELETSRGQRTLPSFVLDASVAAKWFNNENFTDKATKVRDAFVEGKIELYAPEHLIYGVANAIWKNKEIGLEGVCCQCNNCSDRH